MSHTFSSCDIMEIVLRFCVSLAIIPQPSVTSPISSHQCWLYAVASQL